MNAPLRLRVWRALHPAKHRWVPIKLWWKLAPQYGIWVHTAASLDQTGFQFYEDDGTESSSTAVAAEDTSADLDVDTVYHLRIQVDDTASGAENNVNFQLQYNLNTLGWNNVDATSSVAQSAASQLTEDGDTTARLTAPSGGSFITPNSGQDEVDGMGADISFVDGTHDYIEVVYAFQILSGDVSDNDSLQFRVIRSGGTLDNWTTLATATVNEGAATQTLTGGSAFAPTLSFPAGTVAASNDLVGSTFTPTLSFGTGTFGGAWSSQVSEFTFFTGATFQLSPTFPTGNVDAGAQAQTVTGGAAFTPTLSFPQGTVQASNDLVGGVFTPALSFPTGAFGLSNTLTGGPFAPTLSFPQGEVVGAQALTGSVFAPTLTFPTGTLDAGAVEQTLTGSVFAPTLSFPQGQVDQTVAGSVFTPVLSFPQGTLAAVNTLSGSVFTPGLSFPQGTLSTTLAGTVFAPGLVFPQGSLSQDQTLTGSVFTPSLNFPTGVLGGIVTHTPGKTSVTLDASTTDAGVDPSVTTITLDPSRTYVSLDDSRTDT